MNQLKPCFHTLKTIGPTERVRSKAQNTTAYKTWEVCPSCTCSHNEAYLAYQTVYATHTASLLRCPTCNLYATQTTYQLRK